MGWSQKEKRQVGNMVKENDRRYPSSIKSNTFYLKYFFLNVQGEEINLVA